MKYITDVVEFTGAKELFGLGKFLVDGVDYNECTSRLLDGFINHVKIVDSWICNQYGVDEQLPLEVIKEELANYPELIYSVNPSDENNTKCIIILNSLESWVNARNKLSPLMHTKIAKYTEEIILGQVVELPNTYVLFWYSKTRNNSICKFITTDDIDTIKEELLKYLNNISFEEKYQLSPKAYNGWLRS